MNKTKTLVKNMKKQSKILINSLEQTVDPQDLAKEMKELLEKYSRLTELITNTDELLVKIQSEPSGITTDSKEMHEMIESLKDQLQENNQKYEDLFEEKKDAESQLDDLREKLRNTSIRITELEEELMNARKVEKRALENLVKENEGLSKKNNHLKASLKQLKNKLKEIEESAKSQAKEYICSKCQAVYEPTPPTNISNELSAISKSLRELCEELNHQRVMDILMDQSKKAEKAVEERKQFLADTFAKITALQTEILETVSEERTEVSETNIDHTKTMEEFETVPRLDYNQPVE
ncbi:unnamed protein product [Thelazia callipaeda]|uniref:Rab5-bind domain-containing protein n=1 Tax=Thelazia callipaeda TaxID=103827 RepID=A0A0N5CQR8_THECL|nr:unnamed protein product [Thelazia callipaeda]